SPSGRAPDALRRVRTSGSRSCDERCAPAANRAVARRSPAACRQASRAFEGLDHESFIRMNQRRRPKSTQIRTTLQFSLRYATLGTLQAERFLRRKVARAERGGVRSADNVLRKISKTTPCKVEWARLRVTVPAHLPM